MLNLLIKNAKLDTSESAVDIGVKNGVIHSISQNITEAAATVYNAEGFFVCSGFYESHIHLDKACILDRCTIEEGTLDEAVKETGKAKEKFNKTDVFERASRVVEMAIKKGTMGLRTFVETDPKAELRSFEAIKEVRETYKDFIDIEICAFAQEGLTEVEETHQLLKQALQDGADLVGGCPYKDENPDRHIEMIFDLAEEFDVNVDFHLDFDLDPNDSSIPKISEETLKRSYQGRVSIGHVTKLAAMSKEQRQDMELLLKKADIALTVLPATDIFLNGRDHEPMIPRGMVNAKTLNAHGITTTISSNNILNAFTPYGDASLVRMANLYANIAQLSRDEDIKEVYGMITENAAKLLSKQTEIKVGAPANFVILEAKNAIDVVRTVAQALAGFKNGQQTFSNTKAKILSKIMNTPTQLSENDHIHLQHCLSLAIEAFTAGDSPFGSILVNAKNEVLATARNRVNELNVLAHPEIELAHWAANNLTEEERLTTTMYTSGEHCPMCSAAHGWVGIGTLVYLSSGKQLTAWLQEFGASEAPIHFIAVEDIIKSVQVKGPADGELLKSIKELHKAYHTK